MGVRVRVKIRCGGNNVITSALVNSGYEADEPEIHIPLALAKNSHYLLKTSRVKGIVLLVLKYRLTFWDMLKSVWKLRIE